MFSPACIASKGVSKWKNIESAFCRSDWHRRIFHIKPAGRIFRISCFRIHARRMKVYNLSCEQAHRFEGWFVSEEDYSKQLNASQIECPICASSKINRLPSAPRLNLSSNQPVQQNDGGVEEQAQFVKLIKNILSNTEDVGPRFAEEARRMHYNEAPERAIRGVATIQERQELSEEGIEVVPLPVPEALKTPLQ